MPYYQVQNMHFDSLVKGGTFVPFKGKHLDTSPALPSHNTASMSFTMTSADHNDIGTHNTIDPVESIILILWIADKVATMLDVKLKTMVSSVIDHNVIGA